MAASIKAYGPVTQHIQAGDINWTSDTFKLSLHTSGYTPDQNNHEFYSDLTNELTTAGGYTVGGFTISGESNSYDATTREYRSDGNDLSVAALTPSSPFRYAVLRKDTGVAGTSILICYINFGADQDPGGLPFAVQWAATGLFYVQAP